MSVFADGGPKGPGFMTRLAIKMPKSATLWSVLLLLLTLFCPLFFAFGDNYIWWGIAITIQGGISVSTAGWFIILPIGITDSGPIYLA